MMLGGSREARKEVPVKTSMEKVEEEEQEPWGGGVGGAGDRR